jgi:hypothetical protein
MIRKSLLEMNLTDVSDVESVKQISKYGSGLNALDERDGEVLDNICSACPGLRHYRGVRYDQPTIKL